MSTQNPVNVGSIANDGTGDTIRAAFDKVNTDLAALFGKFQDGDTGAAPLTGYSGIVTMPGGVFDPYVEVQIPTHPTQTCVFLSYKGEPINGGILWWEWSEPSPGNTGIKIHSTNAADESVVLFLIVRNPGM